MIQIPRRLRQRPRYRGMAIPFVQNIGPDGVPDFKVTERDVLKRCLENKLCGLCGNKLDKTIYWIGCPEELEKKQFREPPMHKECGEYALQVCPFLSKAEHQYSNARFKYLPKDQIADNTFNPDGEKATVFHLVGAAGYGVISEGPFLISVLYQLLEIENWWNGKKLTDTN